MGKIKALVTTGLALLMYEEDSVFVIPSNSDLFSELTYIAA